MIESVFIAKILVSVISVLGLSLIAEHVSPRVAGVLSGYPLGTAIVLFFVGLENGTDFAAHGAIYTLSGLSASLVMIFIYYKSSQIYAKAGPLISSVTSIVGFLCVAFILSRFTLSLWESLLITALAIPFFLYQFRNIDNVKVGNKVKLTYRILFFRAFVAAFIVVLITGSAKSLGAEWAGILSAFPVTLYPFLLVMHLTYGREQAHTIIKNYPHGIGALVTYTISVSYVYPVYGIYYGTLLAFLFATIYLILYTVVSNYWAAKTV